jgi:hypothetical protein
MWPAEVKKRAELGISYDPKQSEPEILNSQKRGFLAARRAA